MVLDQPVIVREVVELDDCILVPWSKTSEIESLYSKGKPILTHTDLIAMDMPKVPVISGHLHQRFFEGNKINLGSCFAFNFGDSPDKYIYTTEDFKTFTSIENTDSIRFLRVTRMEQPLSRRPWIRLARGMSWSSTFAGVTLPSRWRITSNPSPTRFALFMCRNR